MHVFRPTVLQDLFAAFDTVQSGAAVALSPGGHVDGASDAAWPQATTEMRPPGDGPWLGVWSSGSGGRPRLVWWRWKALLAVVSTSPERRAWSWASPFQPRSFAGVQVALQAWASGGRVVSVPRSPTESVRILSEQQCEALCCTPTFIDLLMQQGGDAIARWHPRQITLSGEVLSSALGRRVTERFERARVTTIFATSELGVLLRSHRVDGWYEADTLACEEWRVREHVLEIKRDGHWVSTGDLVELRGGLIRMIGRADAVANVGGTKVGLAEIGLVAEEVPGVRRAVAVALPNPITGQVVSLRFAVDTGCDCDEVTAALQERLRRRLPKEAWPRSWVLDEIGPAVNAKRWRGVS